MTDGEERSHRPQQPCTTLEREHKQHRHGGADEGQDRQQLERRNPLLGKFACADTGSHATDACQGNDKSSRRLGKPGLFFGEKCEESADGAARSPHKKCVQRDQPHGSLVVGLGLDIGGCCIGGGEGGNVRWQEQWH